MSTTNNPWKSHNNSRIFSYLAILVLLIAIACQTWLLKYSIDTQSNLSGQFINLSTEIEWVKRENAILSHKNEDMLKELNTLKNLYESGARK